MLYQNNQLIIRSWQAGDEAYIARSANNYHIWKMVRDFFPFPYTYDDARDWVELNRNKKVQDNFAVVFNNEPVGNIGFELKKDVYRKSAEIGYWLDEACWGKGIMTESIGWLISYMYSHFDLSRIYAFVFSNNPGSAEVLKKNGFYLEAVLKNAVIKEEQVLNEWLFAHLNPLQGEKLNQ